MSDIDEKALQEEYREEVRTTALRHGRMMAGMAILVLGSMFIHDFFIMDIKGLATTRLIGAIPAAVYLALSFSCLPHRRHLAIPAHIALLTLVMISSGLFSWGLFRSHLEGAAYGAAGTMQAAVLGVFIFGNGVRRHLWAIVVVPLTLTLAAILLCCSPTRVELTLFLTPFITAVCVVAAGLSQDRLNRERFRMGKLVQQHKDELEDKAEALQLANNELQQFAGVVAHDLKVPLNLIQKALKKMKGGEAGHADGPGCPEELQFVSDTADRMYQMIVSMLDYACLQNCSDAFAPVALEDVLKMVTLGLKQLITESGTVLEVAPLPTVWGDRMQLTMLFQELLINAIKYRKPDTPLVIRIMSEAAEAGEVRLSVADNGIGFDPAHRREVFKAYRQLSTPRKAEGCGIGLASCAKIIRHHGGIIGVNTRPAEGATFHFTLPVRPRA